MSWAEDSGARGAELRLEGIVAGYGDEPVVKGVDLRVPRGRVVAIVGPNGAGKSTLLKATLGLVRVRSGHVWLGSADVTNQPLEELARMGIGYVPQGDNVFDSLRVVENLEMGAFTVPRAQRAARIEAVLELFPQLRSMMRRYAGNLSGGERKMVAVGRVLMPDPAVLLLDEPTAGLAPELTRQVLSGQVRMLAELGKAVVVVEQKAHAALEAADDAAVLVGGTVAMSGTAAEILADKRMAELFLGGPTAVTAPAESARGAGPTAPEE
jgi:branched-chain amino acid transport system ATP-binding protein